MYISYYILLYKANNMAYFQSLLVAIKCIPNVFVSFEIGSNSPKDNCSMILFAVGNMNNILNVQVM